jgi:hypothetical protein
VVGAPDADPRWAWGRRGVALGPHRYEVIDAPGEAGPSPRLSVSSGAPPPPLGTTERREVEQAALREGLAQDLAQALEAYTAAIPAAGEPSPDEQPVLDDATRAMLRQLGYAGDDH